ncbi:Peroxisomal coenzyme A diphosphatase NUDT7 [Strongyloides ratti]|uniref:Peroxisomal coenzyme A diphosphatase NUDT7 n=1 Tax=Strongyloides ratti TaxID=34506 RepID=A0A090LD29_STRRB|nr:Peroxisomal coenzyme A diphosphatase NUDT7 [Strongyloides ratti]CEF65425.1 Peroxisomal coenzyme A diphosphatase NUDT7 [Strongyloides ratti]
MEDYEKDKQFLDMSFKPYLVNEKKTNLVNLKKVNASKAASILILLQYKDGDWHVLLTVRSVHLRRHPGEVAFPGGMVDKEDLNDPVKTALREGIEEIGLEINKIDIIGQLPWVRTRYNIIIHPIIGIIKENLILRLNKDEVSQYFTCPLSIFLKNDIYTTFNFNNFQFHSFQYKEYNIYGITAWILIKIAMIIYNKKPQFNLIKF